MSVQAIVPDYRGVVRDRFENFHGNQLVYVAWDKHLMFCAPFAFPVPPEMSFKSLLTDVATDVFAVHPEFDQLDWSKAEWLLDGQPFIPQMDVALKDQGISHKSVLRFQTPELKGYMGADI